MYLDEIKKEADIFNEDLRMMTVATNCLFSDTECSWCLGKHHTYSTCPYRALARVDILGKAS